MIRVRSILLPLVTLAALAAPAAAVPEQLGLTARVVDAGAPITGNHVVTVRLHTAASGGAAVWTENQNVAATDGLVYLTLGAQTPLTDAIIDGGPLWVELQVDSTVLAPRLAVTSAAYAIRAGVAEDSELLGGQPATAFAAASHAHAGQYLPLGTALACAGTDKVASINPTTGSVTCAPDSGGASYSAGPGLTQAGTVFSVAFAGSGVGATAARSDHAHAGTYMPVGTTLACPAGQFETADLASGNVQCAAEVGDIASVTAGAGLTGGTTSGDATLAVAFAGTGGAATAARSDHGHGVTSCPSSYAAFTRTANGVSTVICLRALFGAADWNAASRSCLTDAAAQLCSYQQIIQVRGLAPAFGLQNAFWLADRMGDNTAYVTNTTGPSDDFDSVGTVTDTKAGYYCCLERRWW
ncbi:MAG: hypothetical protein IPH44_36835 [Myxococcales bacterium]|nr:hypothetical protein [Myxococcales bacterium]MBK7191039.1 hypothetical protein [Myxococcales bacterium]